jgi:hypothetical protein
MKKALWGFFLKKTARMFWRAAVCSYRLAQQS